MVRRRTPWRYFPDRRFRPVNWRPPVRTGRMFSVPRSRTGPVNRSRNFWRNFSIGLEDRNPRFSTRWRRFRNRVSWGLREYVVNPLRRVESYLLDRVIHHGRAHFGQGISDRGTDYPVEPPVELDIVQLPSVQYPPGYLSRQHRLQNASLISSNGYPLPPPPVLNPTVEQIRFDGVREFQFGRGILTARPNYTMDGYTDL